MTEGGLSSGGRGSYELARLGWTSWRGRGGWGKGRGISARGEVAVVAAVTARVAVRRGRLDESAVTLVSIREAEVVGSATARERRPDGARVAPRGGRRGRRRVGRHGGGETDLRVEGPIELIGEGGDGGEEGGEGEEGGADVHEGPLLLV